MSETTGIAWTDATFSPWRGCDRVSPGCAHCYAATLAEKYWPDEKLWDKGSVRHVAAASTWRQVLSWNRKATREGVRRRVFPSILDLFEDRPDLVEPRRWYWGLVQATPNLDHLVLTKRPENIGRMLPLDWSDGYPNVWLGVSVESAAYWWRVDWLRRIPAVVRFLSYEPALGPIFNGYGVEVQDLDWVIYGGESGRDHRLDSGEWAEAARQACVAGGIPFFFKQRSGSRPGKGTMPDGSTPREFPVARTA